MPDRKSQSTATPHITVRSIRFWAGYEVRTVWVMLHEVSLNIKFSANGPRVGGISRGTAKPLQTTLPDGPRIGELSCGTAKHELTTWENSNFHNDTLIKSIHVRLIQNSTLARKKNLDC